MAEMTVASTTDTQKDIDLAAGVTPTAEPEKPEQVEAAEPEPEHKPQPTKSAVQKRIDRLVREAREANERAEAAERKLAGTTENVTEVETKPSAETKSTAPKPTENDRNADGTPKYKTYEELVEAIADWKLDIRLAERAEAEQKAKAEQAAKDAQAAAVRKFSERIDKAKKDYDDWDDVVTSRDMPIPPQVGQLIVHDLENGPDVVYYLAQHPEVRKQLNEWAAAGNVNRAIAEVGGISRALVAGGNEGTNDDEGEEPPAAARASVPRPASKAVAPIRPVGGSATRSSVPIDDLPYQEYKKIRNQQIKNRYR